MPHANEFWVELLDAPLPVSDAMAFLVHPDAGGLNVFLGTTRRLTNTNTGTEITEKLVYEAYRPMALSVMQHLAETAATRWKTLRIVVLHRLGEVPVGEVSVCIGVATPHRNAAYEASHWLIDTLKTEVPIWKKDVPPEGNPEWVTPVSSS